jgi:hypothetical protein
LSIISVDKVDNTKAAKRDGRSGDECGFERSEEMKDVAVDRRVVHGVGAESEEHVDAGATGLRVYEGPEGSRPYSWMSDYFPRLDGKVARRDYYARLELSSKRSLDGLAVF